MGILLANEKALIRFDLKYKRRSWNQKEERWEWAPEKDRLEEAAKLLQIKPATIVSLTKKLIDRRIYKKHCVKMDLATRFLRKNVQVSYWVRAKLDYWRGIAHQSLAPESSLPSGTLLDFIERARAELRSIDSQESSPHASLVDVHLLLGHDAEAIFEIQARDENAAAQYVAEKLVMRHPTISSTRTATKVYAKSQWDPHDDSENEVAYARQVEGTRADALESRKRLLELCIQEPSILDRTREQIAERVDIGVDSLDDVKDWLINHGFYKQAEVDPYVARYVLTGRWPVRYILFIKSRYVEGPVPDTNRLSYQRKFVKRLESAFFDIQEERRLDDPLNGITLLDASTFIADDFDVALTILADHEDAAAEFQAKFLRPQKEVLEVKVVTSLVTGYWADWRREFETDWKRPEGS